MSDPTEYSSQIIEEEDFFLDDDSAENQDMNDLSPSEVNKRESFRSLLAGPSGNKVCTVVLLLSFYNTRFSYYTCLGWSRRN
jgi:hypothetical protein